jgi:hypothetical protein
MLFKFAGQVLCISFLAAANVAAQEPDETFGEKFVERNIEISEWFDDVAEGLDLFLVGRRLTRRKNETFVRLENSTFLKDGKDPNNVSSLNANIRLPNFEQYWQLKFSSYDETRERRNVNTGYLRNAPRERNVGATLGIFRKLGNVRTSFQPRVELNNPLKVGHTLNFESVAEYKSFQINPRVEFFATPDRGVGIFDALNFNFGLSTTYSITWVNQSEYEERNHKFTVTHGVSLGQSLNDTQAFSYNFFILLNNRPVYHLKTYTFSLTWSELIYKKVFDYQVSPFLEFDEDFGFQGLAGVTLDLNFHF